MLLRDVEEMSSADVCEVLAISEANQRVLLHRGRGKLRQVLETELEVRREVALAARASRVAISSASRSSSW